jgi:hypothetical protein
MLGLLSTLIATSLHFSGEDPVQGNPWYHAKMTWEAAARAGWATGGGPADDTSAAAALAWHADYVDSYCYNVLWWAAGGRDRFHVSLLHRDELVKLHFDDMTSTRQIELVWARYLAGTVAGLLWAAERGDVAAARNVVGTALHAIQDFYSHSNWVDDPARRNVTWRASAPALVAVSGDLRDALHLYSGAYEQPVQAAFKPHGKFSLDCSLMRQLLPAGLMDVVCAGISPLSNTGFCQRWRECAGATPARIPEVLGVPIPPDFVYIEPPGIALDSKWMSGIAVQQRDLPDAATVGPGLFDVAYNLACEHSRAWLRDLDALMARAGQSDFWENRVKAEPRAGTRIAPVIPGLAGLAATYDSDLAQFEQPWRMPFTFASAGQYPPDPMGGDEGWFLRLEIATSTTTNAGTDADIIADVGGQQFLLDHMHERKGGIGDYRLLEWNDFEAGSHDTYLVGPFASLPGQLVLRNQAADAWDIVKAAWDGLVDSVGDAFNGLRDLLLTVLGGHADYIGADKAARSWQELVGIARAGTDTFTLLADGKDEGKYEVTGLITARPVGDDMRVGVAATVLNCQKESTWDRGSSSDEPFVLLVANSPANRDITSRTIGPLSDVDTGDILGLEHSGDGHWLLSRSDATGKLSFFDAGDTAGFGDLTRPAIRFFTGDFTGDGKTDMLFYCANDGNWWLGRSTGTELQWSVAGNTRGFGDLTRPAIRFFTGDFTGDGKTDMLFYCANDGNWWLGRSTGTELQWSVAGNTARFGDLTRDNVRLFELADSTGDGRTDMLFYCAGDGAWWLGRSTGTEMVWSCVAVTSKFGDLRRGSTRIWTGDFTGDHRRDVLIYMPMLTVTVPRYGGLLVPAQVWESDLEAKHDRDTAEANFRDGVAEDSNERSALLDAIGRAIAPDWKISSLDVYAFRRGPLVEVAHPVRGRTLDQWIDAGASLTVPFDPVAPVRVSLEAPPELPTPQPISPADGAQLTGYPRTTTLTWQPVTGATGYLVEVLYAWSGPQEQGWGSAYRREVSGTTVTFDFVGDQPGRWRITALDTTGANARSLPSGWRGFIYRQP